MSYSNPLVTTDSTGNTSVPVTRQSNTSDALFLHFLKTVSTPLLAVNTTIGTRFVTLQSGHGLTAGSVGLTMLIETPIDATYYAATIRGVVGNVVELSMPIPRIFVVGQTSLLVATKEMSGTDGTTTPVVFRLAPNATQIGDITGVRIATTSNNGSDLTTFGGAPALLRGMLLRKKLIDGTFVNLCSFKSNFELALLSKTTTVFEPKQGNSTHGFTSFVVFNGEENIDSVVRLDGALGEELQIVINDPIIAGQGGNLSVQIHAQGATVIR